METSIFLAKILGLLFIVVGTGIFMNVKTYQAMLGDFVKNAAMIYLGGILAFTSGLVIVLVHNVWIMDWPLLITLMGWAAIVKGMWLVMLPRTLGPWIDLYEKNEALMRVHSLAAYAIGVILLLCGIMG